MNVAGLINAPNARESVSPAVCALISIIGKAATIALAERFAGTRLYIPRRVKPEHAISLAIGYEAARMLCENCGPGTIRVPLARDLRASQYRAEGLSNARIAVRLGLTESGVRSLLKRLERDKNSRIDEGTKKYVGA